ncbi:Periplasmic (Sec) triheme cytochrome c [Candidatus Sulfopaludibacter sp. SbA6]|nr:Periplasmic (Sec) triheme cytochrome c [Candidatus Sulfopaludibacter sp. SbA6]
MRDRALIWSGLLIFLGILTLPIWHNLAAHVTAKGPDPVLPAREKQCVAPLEFMKSSHMTLLLDWRDRAVREGEREYTTADGRHYALNLSSTCLAQCHAAKADFCDRCHNYAAVSPPCWDCHLDRSPR